MPKYKILKSIAHNTGHSFLAASNHFDGGFPFEHLLRSCREAKVTRVQIDMLQGTITPLTLLDRWVQKALTVLTSILDSQLESGGWSRSALREATIGLDLVAGTCVSRIVDDRGVEHQASVVQWGGVQWSDWQPVFETLARDA